MSVGIYLIHNIITGKNYIGQSLHIERRWAEHRDSANRTADNHGSILIQAIQKYGWQNFQCSIIEETSAEKLDERERYWIQQYNSLVPNGYNVQLGGKTGAMTCPENIREIQDLLVNSDLSMDEIAQKYGMCRRSIIRINQGHVWNDTTKNYPLRARPIRTKGDGSTICPRCGAPKTKGAAHCLSCFILLQRTVERPSEEELLTKIAQQGFAEVGREYGVSGKAVANWCRIYGLPTKKKDIVDLYNKLH